MTGLLSRSLKLITCPEWSTSWRPSSSTWPSCNSVRAYRITLHKFTFTYAVVNAEIHAHEHAHILSLRHGFSLTQTPCASPSLLPCHWTDTQSFKYSSEVIYLRCLWVAVADLSSTAVALSLSGSVSDLFMKCVFFFSLPAGELKLLAG